jgi:hypothetical protein
MKKVASGTYLKWEEPREYRKMVVDKKLPPRKRLIYVIIIGLLILALPLLLNLERKRKISFWFIILGPVAFIGQFYMCLYMDLVPRKVGIREDGIFIESVGKGRLWKYGKLYGFQIKPQLVNKREFDVLCLKLPRGKELCVGISDEVPLEEVGKFLSDLVEHKTCLEEIKVNNNL